MLDKGFKVNHIPFCIDEHHVYPFLNKLGEGSEIRQGISGT